MFKLLTADWCTSCGPAKDYINDNNLVGVSIMNVEDYPQVVSSCGVKGVPSLLTPDNEVIAGTEKIIQYLKENYDKITDPQA